MDMSQIWWRAENRCSMRRHVVLLLVVLIVTYGGVPGGAGSGWIAVVEAGSFVTPPYLQAVTHDSAYVLVEIDSASPDAVVEYGQSPSYGWVVATEYTELTQSPNYVHNIRLTGLLANTQYHYQVSHEGTVSGDFTFWTAAYAGTDFRFAWAADMRTQPSVWRDIAPRIAAADPRFSLYGGDLVTSGSSYANWANEFFVAEHLTLAAEVPFFNAIGNHEGFGPLTIAFTESPDSASGQQDYYSFDYGDLHVLVLNNQADDSVGSAQYNFALSDLSGSTAQWKIVAHHKSAYVSGSSHGEEADMKVMSSNIFEPYGVDMVLSGHSHFYQHNYVNGIHHVVMGSVGAPLGNPYGEDYTIYQEKTYNYGIFDVTPDTLRLMAYRRDGTEIEGIDLSRYTGDLDFDGDVDLDDYTILAGQLTGPAPPAAYYQTNGMVTVEAEHYTSKTEGSGAAAGSAWADLAGGGSLGDGYVQALPNSGVGIDAPEIESDAPRLSYLVYFETAGIHYLWVKGWADAGGDDSVHYGLDGSVVSTGFNDSATVARTGGFAWTSGCPGIARPIIDVPSAGLHTVDLWMREDGARIDRVLLTIYGGYTPLDPAESTLHLALRGDLDEDGDCDVGDFAIFSANFTGPG